jgi:hypothetical protein
MTLVRESAPPLRQEGQERKVNAKLLKVPVILWITIQPSGVRRNYDFRVVARSAGRVTGKMHVARATEAIRYTIIPNPACTLARPMAVSTERKQAMKIHLQAVFAALALLLAGLAPASALAEHSAGTHSHTASYHDHTPVAHTHGIHDHHRG